MNRLNKIQKKLRNENEQVQKAIEQNNYGHHLFND